MRFAKWPLIMAAFLGLATGCPGVEKECVDNFQRSPVTREVIFRFLNEGQLELADQILQDSWPVPRFEAVKLPAKLTWSEDPYNEKYWRFLFYGFRPVANLLWAYQTTGDVKYKDKLLDVTSSFLNRTEDSEFVWDPHTAAFRTMMLVNIYIKLKDKGELPEAIATSMVTQLEEHGEFLSDENNYESDYNHALAEAAALLLVAEIFPQFSKAKQWRTIASTRIGTLLENIVDPDGVEVENSPFYHFYFLEGFWDLYIWAIENNFTLPSNAEQKIRKMLRYATYIVLPDGTLPLMGASLNTDIPKKKNPQYGEMMELDPEFRYMMRTGVCGSPPVDNTVTFPASGQVIMRSDFGDSDNFSNQTHVVFDTGPFRTNHSHLDALSVHLYAAGQPLLVDSGLFTYEPGAAFDYFHGTQAHNTVSVDDLDQKEGTGTLGLFKAEGDWVYQSAKHELYDGVLHKRAVMMLRADLLMVVDDVTSDATHKYEQLWHLAPGAEISKSGLDVKAAFAGQTKLQIVQSMVDGISLNDVSGVNEPMSGWYSEKYEEKVPIHTLKYQTNATTARYVTLFAAGNFADDVFRNSVTQSQDSWDIRICGDDAQYQVHIANLAAGGEQIQIEETPSACP